MADQKFIGDYVEYIVEYQTIFTTASDWENMTQAVGASPSLIINGTITADGEAEGFVEDRINVNRSIRSFIAAKADREILIGNIGSTALKAVVSVCQSFSMVNAMCLDGGSVGLYYSRKRQQAWMSIMRWAARYLAAHKHSLQSSTPDIRMSRVLPPWQQEYIIAVPDHLFIPLITTAMRYTDGFFPAIGSM